MREEDASPRSRHRGSDSAATRHTFGTLDNVTHSTLSQRLEADMKDALRAGEKLRLSVIRRARSAIKNAEIEAGGPLDDDGVVRALRGMAKQHRESIDQFRAGNRADLADREVAELAILSEYLPAQLDKAAVEAAVREVIAQEGATDVRDMGRVMKATMARLGSSADGSLVSAAAKALLSEQ